MSMDASQKSNSMSAPSCGLLQGLSARAAGSLGVWVCFLSPQVQGDADSDSRHHGAAGAGLPLHVTCNSPLTHTHTHMPPPSSIPNLSCTPSKPLTCVSHPSTTAVAGRCSQVLTGLKSDAVVLIFTFSPPWSMSSATSRSTFFLLSLRSL